MWLSLEGLPGHCREWQGLAGSPTETGPTEEGRGKAADGQPGALRGRQFSVWVSNGSSTLEIPS